jgi:hypothetical protein
MFPDRQSNQLKESYENEMRKHIRRRKEPNYSGAGFWYAGYPTYIGALSGYGSMGAADGTAAHESQETPSQEAAENASGGSEAGEGAAATTGMGAGGTAAS